MKDKKIATVIAIILIGIILISLDWYKTYKEEKPPIPHISIGNESIPVLLGPYEWNGGPMNNVERNEILKEANSHPVNPLEDLHIQFPEEKSPSDIEVYFSEKYLRNDYMYPTNYYSDHDIKVNIPNDPRMMVLNIKAHWDGKKRAEYYVLMDILEVSPLQSYLPEGDGNYSLLYYYGQENEDYLTFHPIYSSDYQFSIIPFWVVNGFNDPLIFKNMFPNLTLSGSEQYWVLDKEGVIFETNSLLELAQFFNHLIEPSPLDFYGIISNIDKEEKMLTLHTTKIYYEHIDELQIGQTVQIQATFHDIMDTKKTTVHDVHIIEEQPKELQNEQMFAKENGNYTVLFIADEDYFKYGFNRNEIEHLVEEIYTETISIEEYHPLAYEYVVFDNNGPIFISYRIEEVKKLLTDLTNTK